MATWKIKGEAGKSMNATVRTFAQLRVSSAVLQFQSLAADTFTYQSVCDDATGAGPVLPEEGQVVELFRDTDRKFYGHVTKVEPGDVGMIVEVQNPWMWLQQVMLSSSQTDATGATAERVKYEFGTTSTSLRQMFLDLMDLMVDAGIPMQAGSVAAMFPFTNITLANMTLAEALTSLMRRVVDAVAVWDYSGASGDYPTLKIARRNGADAMTEKVYELGVDAVNLGRLRARTMQEIRKVRLPYMDRHPTTKKPRFKVQESDAITGDGALGKLQIVTVSGEEIVDFLPLETFESKSVKTVPAGSITNDYVSTTDSGLAAIKKEYGIEGGIGYFVRLYKPDKTLTFPGVQYQRDSGTYLTDVSGKHLVISNDFPSWAFEQYNGINVTVTGTWIALWDDSIHDGEPWSAAFKALQAGAQTGTGFQTDDTVGAAADWRRDWLARPWTIRGVLIDTAFATATTVYKDSDYEFINPPAGMANGLREAQNWVPYEGPFTVELDTVTGDNRIDRVISIDNARAEFSTMKAMVKSMSYDLMTRTISYQLGAPARTDLATAMGRTPVSPQDVVIPV